MASDANIVLGQDTGRAGFGSLLRRSLAAHAPIILLSLTVLVLLKFVGILNPRVVEAKGLDLVTGILTFSVPLALLSLLVFTFANMVLTVRPASPTKELYLRMKAVLGNPRRLAMGVPMFATLLTFMYGFTMFKANITAFVPFSWDVTFDAWDKALHFGVRPYEWLLPLFNNVPATILLNVNYNAWFIIMNMFWVYFAFVAAPGAERTRFFLAFMLTWSVGGILFATLLSSAGPCYFGRLGLGPDPYAPLMASLHAVHAQFPVWALDTQDMLWHYRQQGSSYGGISAMPSMHNATTLLFVLVCWNKAPWLRNMMIVHAVFIYLGSIHLGWHYAIDSYLSWIIVLPLWFATSRFANWWEAKPQQQAFARDVEVAA